MTEPPDASLTSTRFIYQRCGYDSRIMSFQDNHRIGEGRGGCELSCSLEDGLLRISGWSGVTCRLARFPDGTWRGRWLLGEQMPILLSPVGHAFARPALVSLSFCANHQKSWTTDRSGRIASQLHYNMLVEALWHWGRSGLPVLVAATAWSTVEANEHERRLAEPATATTRFVVHGSGTPHQDDAWWCIKAALEHAALNGFDYLVVAAEDTLPLDPQLPVHLVQDLKATGTALISHYWCENVAYNTQVFACHVPRLIDRWLCLPGGGNLEERLCRAMNREVVVLAPHPGEIYYHSHDPGRFLALAQSLRAAPACLSERVQRLRCEMQQGQWVICWPQTGGRVWTLDRDGGISDGPAQTLWSWRPAVLDTDNPRARDSVVDCLVVFDERARAVAVCQSDADGFTDGTRRILRLQDGRE